ncbi:MAG: tol-pal system protein YbgF [Gammaproteobacteria bacterium]|nr:tol-pal system protein YbgF [Gammaproteobacteria bacterium]
MCGFRRLMAVMVMMAVASTASAADRLQDRRNSDFGSQPDGPVPAKKSGPSNLVELLVQLDNLQNEVKQLRNQVEIQNHQLQQLKESQRNATRDVDQRLQRLEGGVGGAPVAAVDKTESAPEKKGGAIEPGVAKLEPGKQDVPEKPAAATPAPSKPVDTSVQAQEDYDAAFKSLKNGYYQQAIQSFTEFIDKYPKHKLASNAQYWIAKSHFVTRNYKQALSDFDKTIDSYPNSSKIPDAMLNKGYALYELGRYKEARKVLETASTRYKNTRTGKRASERLARMKKEGR